jgi:hypothetical protein
MAISVGSGQGPQAAAINRPTFNAVTVVPALNEIMTKGTKAGDVHFTASYQETEKARNTTGMDVFRNRWNGAPLPEDVTRTLPAYDASAVTKALADQHPVTLTTQKLVEVFDSKRKSNVLHSQTGVSYTFRSLEELTADLPDLISEARKAAAK